MAPLRIKRPTGRVIKKSSRPAPATTGKRSVSGKTSKTSEFEKAKRKAGVTGYAGASGFKQAKREKEISDKRRERNSLPWRLWLAPASEADFILTSDQPYFFYEHQMKGADGKPIFERCIKDQGHCPLCSKTGREGYYVMMLEGIDLRGFKTKKGETVKFSKKLFPVKQSQMSKYERLYQRNGNSFRGLKLHLIRDGEKDATIGNDVEMLAKIDEQKLVARYKDAATPIDMDKAFKALTEKEMQSQYNTGRPAGSSDFNSDDDDSVDDDESWD